MSDGHFPCVLLCVSITKLLIRLDTGRQCSRNIKKTIFTRLSPSADCCFIRRTTTEPCNSTLNTKYKWPTCKNLQYNCYKWHVSSSYHKVHNTLQLFFYWFEWAEIAGINNMFSCRFVISISKILLRMFYKFQKEKKIKKTIRNVDEDEYKIPKQWEIQYSLLILAVLVNMINEGM